MKLKVLNCKNCGGHLLPTENEYQLKCDYCGTLHLSNKKVPGLSAVETPIDLEIPFHFNVAYYLRSKLDPKKYRVQTGYYHISFHYDEALGHVVGNDEKLWDTREELEIVEVVSCYRRHSLASFLGFEDKYAITTSDLMQINFEDDDKVTILLYENSAKDLALKISKLIKDKFKIKIKIKPAYG